MDSIKKPIVIVGCGFAGVNTALTLKRNNPSLPILVVDSKSKFIFKPLLYEVLSNEIKTWEVSPSFEHIFLNSGITFLQNELIKINLSKKSLHFKDDLIINYQLLVLCTGSSPNNFSIKGVDEYCYFFNNIDDQNKLKNFLEENKISLARKKIFIVGAGPSGVELACKIYDLHNEFEICLIESTGDILNKNKLYNREEAEKALQKRNIKLLLNTTVKEISPSEIKVIDKLNQVLNLKHDAVIWTAGIKPNLPNIDENITTVNGRIFVNKKLQLNSFQDVFAIGDIAVVDGNNDLPITAQVAMQQGKHVSKNIYLKIHNKDLLPFEFKDNGEMISLGLGEASISGLGLTFSGKLAFDLRRLIYASKMPALEKGLKSTASWLIDKKSIFFK